MFASASTFIVEPDADLRLLDIRGFENTNEEKAILSVYTEAGNVQRTLMRFNFDEVPIPPGEYVVSAVLSLRASTGYGGSKGNPTEVYRVTSSWNEKTATWNWRDTGVPWSAPGGEYVGQGGLPDLAPYASNNESPAEGGVISWEIANLVAAWVEGTVPNNGLLLRSYDGNGLTFAQRETTTAAFRPNLVIITSALPLLRAEAIGGGQVLISWAGLNVGVLEENSALASTGWKASGPVAFAGGRSQVVVPAADARKFFRLRSP
jgi:hypothetical protein